MRAIPDASAGSRRLEILQVDHEAGLALVRVIEEGGTSSRTRWSLLKDHYEGRSLEEAAKTPAGDALFASPCYSDRNLGSGEPKRTDAEPAEGKAEPKEAVKRSCRGEEEKLGKADTEQVSKSFYAGVTGNGILEAGRAQEGHDGTAEGKGAVALVDHSSSPPKQVCGVSEATKTDLTMVREAEVVNIRYPEATEVPRKVETALIDNTLPPFQVNGNSTIEEVATSNSDGGGSSDILRQQIPPTPMAMEKSACTVTAPLGSLPSSASAYFDAQPMVVEPDDIAGVEIRASSSCRRTVCSEAGGNQGAGLGVFCSRGVKTGEVVFKEDALMHVSRSQVAPKLWKKIELVVQEVDHGLRMKKIESLPPVSRDELCKELEGWVGSGVSEMDLLQAIIFDRADSAVQRRVLGLYAPEEGSFPVPRRLAWSAALDSLSRIGVVGSNTGNERVEAVAESDNSEWRAPLMRVLRICEANIFGQHDDEEVEHGPRSLFLLACRINHSCLPNCSFLVEEGTMTVRAMTDLKPGTELSISYLTFDDALKPTQQRRDVLRAIKYFDCHCCRCSTTHDFTRGIRCPRCYKGAVYPPTQELQRRPSKHIDRKNAVDASACTACNRVPTRGWLTSAVTAEQRVVLDVNTCLEDFARLYMEVRTVPIEEKRHLEMALTQCGAGMARVYAKALYLLGDHHVMCVLHDYLTEFLMMEGRMEEAAYHNHERLVILLNIMGRPSTSMINEFERLAYCLSTVAGLQQSVQQVPKGYWLPPLAGRCGTYAGLVQISPKVREAEGRRTPAAESGYCSVCDRRHGRPCDFVRSGQIDDTPLSVEGTSGTPNFANDQQVYLEGSRAALRDALKLSSVVHGHDSMYTVQARCRFQDVERRAAELSSTTLP